jgi:ribosomal protection tetracycline resistance protein
LIDTPGHPDFIAEVDRSLSVLDGAILVVSAVEGVQAQTIVLNEALERLRVPTILFVNKIDRPGADAVGTIAQIRMRLRAPVVALGTVRDGGRPRAAVDDLRWAEAPDRELLCSQLAAYDESLLNTWVQKGMPSARRLRETLQVLTRQRRVTPALFGSARTTAGVQRLIDAALTMFPSSSAAVDAPVAGQVFKVERTSRGHRVCSVRLRAGMLAVREHVVVGHDRHGTVTALEVHQPGGAVQTVQAYAGQIARVRGLEQARVGDWIGARSSEAAQLSFPAPAMESTITAVDPRQQNELFSALVELTDVDPLIGLQTRRDELSVSLYGAVQQEVIAETLSAEYGIDVRFGPPTVICLERLTGQGQAV